MKTLWLALLVLFSGAAMTQTTQEVGSYPNASSPLTGTERMLADQGAFNTVNITPAQIEAYIATQFLSSLSNYGVLFNNNGAFGALLPMATGVYCFDFTSLSAAPSLTNSCGGGSTIPFSGVISGTNTGTLTMGTGGSFTPAGGIIAASQAATTPTQCTGSQVPTGVDINFNATGCFTPSGSGNVSNSGTPTAGQFTTWVDATHIQGTTAGSNTLVGNAGSGLAALTPAQIIGLINSAAVVTEIASFTPTDTSNANGEYDMDCSAACTFTLPANASVAYAVDTVLTIASTGSANVAIALSGGVTLTSAGALSYASIGPAGGIIQVQKTATDTWRQLKLDPGYATFAVTGTCTTSGAAGGNTGGSLAMGGAGGCTIIITPGGGLTAKSKWVGTIFDQTQNTVPALMQTSANATSATFTAPAAYANLDNVTVQIQPE